MNNELDKLLAETKESKTPADPSAEALAKVSAEVEAKKQEAAKLEEQKANLATAIEKQFSRLSELRKERKIAESGTAKADEEELPKIDLNDPSAKAWDKHIKDSVTPLKSELEKEKQETFKDALKEFILDHPEVNNPDKLKQLVDTYSRLSEGQISERRIDSVLKFLTKSYLAEFGENELNQQNSERVRRVKTEAAFSEAGISRGATGYRNNESAEKTVTYNEEELRILQKWGMEPKDHAELAKKFK